jgi:hypothetical protein
MSLNAMIWVFNGVKAQFPSGLFLQRELAEEWIKKNHLTGILTAYPINISVYEWAISSGYFTPKKEYQCSPDFVSKFTSASQEHYHYENGILG